MRRWLAAIAALLLANTAIGQVTTNPSATGVPAPQSAVTITGGTINNTAIGTTTPAAGNFAAVTTTGTMTIGTGGSTGKAMCWKAAGLLGYCSSVVGVGGDCTCN